MVAGMTAKDSYLSETSSEVVAGGSRWHVWMKWDVVDGRAEVVELRVRAIGKPRAITASVLRDIRGEVFEAERARVVERLGWKVFPMPGSTAEDAERAQQHKRAQRDVFTAPRPRKLTGRKGDTLSADEGLRAVAEEYQRAYAAGEAPTKAVARAFKLSRSGAAKRVARARERGFLPKTEQGRPKGG
jgi:hypothetical protein